MELGEPKGGGLVRGQNALSQIATKQCLGHLMILEGRVQNALLKIATKQYLRLLMMLDFDT